MSKLRNAHRTLAGGLVLAAALAAPAVAQIMGDRQLLSTGGGDPYVMILFDTSGSMNWATKCDAQDRADGLCFHDCASPNCPQPRNGDDPNSKIYQAKQVLYDAIDEIGPGRVRWGFAALNQDQSVATAKHWLYRVTDVVTAGSDPSGLTAVPVVNATNPWYEVFGPSSGGAGVSAFNIGCDRRNPASAGDGFLYEAGCYMNSTDAVALNTTDTWSLNKLRRLPKGGATGNSTATYFLKGTNSPTSTYYRVSYSGVSGAPVDYSTATNLSLTVTIESCASGNVGPGQQICNTSWTSVSTKTVTYEKVGPFFFWEGSISSTTSRSKNAYFGGRTDGLPVALTGVNWANALYADKTCRGWEPSGVYPGRVSNITETDPYNSLYNLKVPTNYLVFDPAGTVDDWIFRFGDIIPLRWDDMLDDVDDNFFAVLERLNPNPNPAASDDEKFGQAPYFADSAAAGESFLRLKVEDDGSTTNTDEAVRPLVSQGSTPLAGWFSMFRRWYSGCGDPGNCDDTNTGWQDIAAQFDPTFNCTKKYVLMITDGEESCDGSVQAPAEDYYELNIDEFPDGFSKTADQCRYRASLNAQEGVESIVIGFGVENKAKLQCANTPVFYADTVGELEDLLRTIFGEILEEAASFASAAVPTVQANILDKTYLSSFIPLEETSIWPGRLDAFLKPVPLDASNLPDRSAVCQAGQQFECFAWDAGDSQLGWDTDGPPAYDPQALLLQAPLVSEISRDFTAIDASNDSLQIGDGADERRLFFGRPDDATDLAHRRYFRYPTNDSEWLDLEFVWNITVPADVPDLPLSDNRKAAIADIIEFTLQEKQALINKICTAGAGTGQTCTANADCDSPAPVGPGDGICTDNAKIQYVMGDIFHSNPVVINPPADFDLFTKDLYWNSPLCGDDLAGTRARGEQISYSWYSNKNICRRVMMAVGSNDGQLHVFDAGIIRDITLDDPTTPLTNEEEKADCLLNVPTNSASYLANLFDDDGLAGDYDFGTGREIFSFVPQAMMPFIKELSEIDELTTEYGIDGTVRPVDVFIDPVPTAGVATCEQRTWRTLLLGSYREGGPGVFALDITQPDIIEDDTNQPIPLAGTPEYVPSCIDGGNGCDAFCISGDTDCAALPFPALKWEFRDLDALGLPADDDQNGVADLAESWSRPLVFRHPACEGICDSPEEAQDRWLAVFGGGLAELPTNDATETAGNWLYMVDIETGQILYKRGGSGILTTSPIVGAVPSDITGVDFDVDGIVDTLYFGTTAGYVYKVDLGDEPWELDEVSGLLVDPAADVGRYDPFQVFTTGGQSIYLEINTVYVPRMRANALLFGTGIRWDLWDESGSTGRFYALLDQDWSDADRDGVADEACVGCPTPLNETVYQAIDPDDLVSATSNFLYGGVPNMLPGWYFILEEDEKLITEPFTLSGITFFTIFSPLESERPDETCARGGESKIFVVNTVTTQGYAIQAGATDRTRYVIAPTFTTQPFVESSATKNAPTSSSTFNSDSWTTELREINADLRRLFPPGARFANYTLDVKTIRKDTGLVFIAPVPVAIEPHNWKEF